MLLEQPYQAAPTAMRRYRASHRVYTFQTDAKGNVEVININEFGQSG